HTPVEPGVRPAERLPPRRRVALRQPVGLSYAGIPGPFTPRGRVLARVEEEELQAVAEPLAQSGDDAGVEEQSRRERVREDEPGRAHEVARACSAMRSASDDPSSPWKRSASAGVPHAGQPSTPKTVTVRPSSSRRSASPSAATGAWSSTTKMSPNGSTRSV